MVLYLHFILKEFLRVSSEFHGLTYHVKTSTPTGSQMEILQGAKLVLLLFI